MSVTTSDTATTSVGTGERGTTGTTATELATDSDEGPLSECGNGKVEPGEDCENDGGSIGRCGADCTFAFDIAWTVSINGSADEQDVVSDVVIDSRGMIYLAGSVAQTKTGRDLWVAQYSPDGTPAWTTFWDGGEMDVDSGNAIALFEDGNLAVVGRSRSAQGLDRPVAMRVLASDGAIEWVQVGLDAALAGVAVDPAGDVIAVGETDIPEGSRTLVRKYDGAGGNTMWTTIGAPESKTDIFARSVAVGNDGELFVLVDVSPGFIEFSSELRVFNQFGVLGESALFEGVELQDVAVDPQGMLVMSGFGEPDPLNLDIIVLKLDPTTFQEVWRVEVDGPSGGSDFSEDVAVDAAGDVYLVGQWSNAGTQRDVVVRKFDGGDGTAVWGDSYNNERASLNDRGLGIAVGPSGEVVAAGHETVLGQGLNGWLRRYTQGP